VVKLQKFDNLLLKKVFEAHRIKGVTPFGPQSLQNSWLSVKVAGK